MKPTPSFLDDLKLAAERATAVEEEFQREFIKRTKALETERAFAFRRLNFMRAIADVVATAEGEEIAVAAAAAVLRTKLGWVEDSDVRDEVATRFAPVAQAMYASLSPEIEGQDKQAPAPDVMATLADFERWYAGSHEGPFWVLFETYLPETPRVDF
jgi:hypothetical protein